MKLARLMYAAAVLPRPVGYWQLVISGCIALLHAPRKKKIDARQLI